MKFLISIPAKAFVAALLLPLLAYVGLGQEASQNQKERTRSDAPIILEGHRDGIYSIVFLDNGRCLASGSRDGTIKLYDISKRAELATLTGHAGQVIRL